MDLKNAVLQIWASRHDRMGIQTEFKPVFYRFAGMFNVNDYNNILKTLQEKCIESPNLTLVFDGEIPIDSKMAIIFSPQLDTINIDCIKEEDIAGLFPAGSKILQVYVSALNYVIAAAKKKENFQNKNIEKNFVKKLIVWSFSYIKQKEIVFNDAVNPKCIYYGSITRHEIYFLIMLYLLSFDVLYINPEKDPYYWNEIDQDNLSSLVKGNLSLPCESFESRCKKGKRINQVDSVTFQMQEELHSTFYTNGVYQPWQFRKGTTESVFINGTVMDLTVSWNEPAKARQGFSVHDMTVSVPYFFQKIEGEYLDKKEYKKLVETCTSAPNTVFVKGNGTALLPKNISRDDMLSLTFCLDNNGKLDYEKVKERPFYSLNCYKEEIQKLIIHKINETLDDEGLFNFTFNKEEKLQYMMMVMNMDAVFIRAIDNFDFTSYIPKIVIFLEKETVLDNTFACFLGFFTKIGFDIVIFDPSGLYNPHVILNEDHLNIIRLDEMNYESTYESLSQIKEKKEGFFKRFFL